jgi:ubiquinone/menaquinone biosynthesis C-methylase UbiE
MVATVDKVFAGSIPEFYERFMVPLIFEPYALDLAARLAKTRPAAVLETAAGTGVVTRALAAALPAETRLTITDLNQPMLDHAKSRQPADSRITWKQADALALPFEDRSFDAVACQFGAMFFPDKVQGYREAHRVLKPGGHFFFSVWDRIEENDFADVITQELAAVFPNDPPRFLARTPHGYHDEKQIREDVKAAGFTNISIDAVDARSKAASPRDPAVAYCEGTPLRSEIEARGAPGLQEATNKAADAMARKFGTGAVDGRIRALVISAS